MTTAQDVVAASDPGIPAVPPAVQVQSVSKTFALPHQRYSTLKERALHPFRSRTFDELRVLRDIDFAVAEGEFFGIVGRNGSGKSTLLKCLAGIYGADEGAIDIHGRLSPFIELGVGFNADLTARDNVILNATMLGLTRREARQRFDAIIEFAELEDFLDLKLKNYSSGMSVRLAFSVAIQVDADILLIDEVLAVGDASFQRKCFDEFHRLKAAGKTIIFVTHDMGAVERFCDRAMLIDRGRIVSIDAPHRIARAYNELNFQGAAATDHDDEPGRFGSREMEVTDAWFENGSGERVTAIGQGERLQLCLAATAHADVPAPVFVFQLRNEEGVLVFATSTELHGVQTSAFRSGERATVRASLENAMAPGSYTVTPAIARAGEAGNLLDVRENFERIVVHGTRYSGGIVDLPHELEIERA
jgi:ABC-type polysaccharide/polyol phosphate transport system ATPase subunit